MGEMRKSPEEIKKGLECCIAAACMECPYYPRECDEGVMEKDVKSYIRQLEANDSQVKKSLQDNGFQTFEELLQAYSQVKRERDAAVKILTDIAHITEWFGDVDICSACKKDNCKECRLYNEGFEWRGLPEGD